MALSALPSYSRLCAVVCEPVARAWLLGVRLANSRPLPFVKWPGALSLRDAPPELLSLLNLEGQNVKKEAAAEAAA